VDADDYYALFAHFAIGTINNFIQRQFEQQALKSGIRALHGFGNCRRLWLGSFGSVKTSFRGVSAVILVVNSFTTSTMLLHSTRDVNNFFKTLAKLVSRPVFSLAKSENNWPKI
jgi:hypothetical protein